MRSRLRRWRDFDEEEVEKEEKLVKRRLRGRRELEEEKVEKEERAWLGGG